MTDKQPPVEAGVVTVTGEGKRGRWWCRWHVRLALVLMLLVSVEIGREMVWTVEDSQFDIFDDRGIVFRNELNVSQLWEEFHAERMPKEGEREEWGEKEGQLGDKKVAYAFYITGESYACAARILVEQFRAYGSQAGYLVVYLEGKLSEETVRGMQEDGIDVRKVQGLPYVRRNAYYRDVLVKLRVFEQFDYDRLIFMDADTYAGGSLDELFHLKLKGEEKIAAPWNYYSETAPFKRIMPWLLVIEPTKEIWRELQKKYLSEGGMRRVQKALGNAYDGEVINLEFQGDRSLKLPPQYAVLNSEWCQNSNMRNGRAYHFFQERGVAEQAARGLIHFSCWQKPWMHHASEVDGRRQLDPFLKDVYHKWYMLAEEMGCKTQMTAI